MPLLIPHHWSLDWSIPDINGFELAGNLLFNQKTKKMALFNLKPFADDILTVTQNIKSVFHRIENNVGKGENAGYQHFLLFPQCFPEAFPSGTSKSLL